MNDLTSNDTDLCRLAPAAGGHLVIVGGCGGIGRCLLDAALSNGLQVIVLDLPTSIGSANLPADVLSFALDATDPQQVEQVFAEISKHWSHIDYLVNLAGFMGEKHGIDAFPMAQWDAMFKASFDSTLNVCRTALPLLQKSAGLPGIVNMSSGLAEVCNPGYGPYNAAKAAVVALTKTLAKENAPHVRVNCVAPGGIQTPFLTGGTGRQQVEARITAEQYAKLVPMGRIGQPVDVVGPILFLLSSAAGYMTGQTLFIDGGAVMP